MALNGVLPLLLFLTILWSHGFGSVLISVELKSENGYMLLVLYV